MLWTEDAFHTVLVRATLDLYFLGAILGLRYDYGGSFQVPTLTPTKIFTLHVPKTLSQKLYPDT